MRRGQIASLNKFPPIHPGEILEEEFLRPMNITQYRLAKSIGVDARRVHAIVNGERSISAETALLFSRFFGNSAEFWMSLQSQYDLEVVKERLGQKWWGFVGEADTDHATSCYNCTSRRCNLGSVAKFRIEML